MEIVTPLLWHIVEGAVYCYITSLCAVLDSVALTTTVLRVPSCGYSSTVFVLLNSVKILP